MESTGGDPDIAATEEVTGAYIFYDCAAESPKGRRGICCDRKIMDSRKENKPANNAIEIAVAMGIELLTETQYRELQQFGPFDTKTPSWLLAPAEIRKLGGAPFGEYRYGQVFVYHNGARPYYASRGFRGALRV